MVLTAAFSFVLESAVGVVVQAAADFGRGHFDAVQAERGVAEAMSRALSALFREMPELDRPEAAKEFGPALRAVCEDLVSSARQPDVTVLGRSLCHGTPTPCSPEAVGQRLFQLLLQELYAVAPIRSRLSEWLVFQVTAPRLFFGPPPAPEALPAEQRAAAELAATEKAPTLLEWPQTLPTGDWLERPELDELLTRVRQEAHSSTLLLGGPGLGKSALLARLGQFLLKDSEPPTVFAIKADQIGPDVDSAEKLGAYLGLEGDPAEVLRRLARDRKVVLLVDQMDAVADIVDLTSRRLSLLLDLIAALDKVENVHIVASSRTFEYNHDPRFVRIDPKTVTLQPPPWEVVRPILEEAGAAPENWPHDRQEEMRRPHALSAFLALASDLGGAAHVASSYHGMLSQLWDRRLDDPDVRKTVAAVAEAMLRLESLSEPLAKWEAQRPQLDAAINAGILIRSPDGLKVSFRHQTLFDHAVARAFQLENRPIADYVLEHQDSLFPRPRIWSILGYLRDLDRQQYEQGLEALWATPDLRLHLRYLLLDFLGAQEAPTAREQRLILDSLDSDDFVMKAAKAAAGGKGWLDVLLAGKLRELMCGSEQQRFAARLLLSGGLPYAQGQVLNLLRTLWQTPQDRPRLVQVLQDVPVWTDEAVALVDAVADDEGIGDHVIQWLAETMGTQRPADAAKLVHRRLGRETQKFLAQEEGAEKLGALFSGHAWYNLEAIAEAAPSDFLGLGLPWFVPVIEAHTWWPATEDDYAHTRLHGTFDIGDRRHSDPLVSAFTAALLKLAEEESADLEPFVAQLCSAEVDLIQRMVSRVMEVVARKHPERALAFLQGDARRFKLGPHQAFHLETRRLLRAVASGGDAAVVQRACETVRQHEPTPVGDYWTESADRRRDWTMRLRHRRLLLLHELPLDLLSEEQRRWRDEEVRACPDVAPERDDDSIGSAWRPAPSMPATGMLKASDDQIIDYLKRQRLAMEASGWRRSVSFDDAFREFAKQEPGRATAIIDRLPVEGYESGVAGVLYELSEVLNAETFFTFVRAQRTRGHLKGRHVEDFAWASARFAKAPGGLPDDMIALFEAELRQAPAVPNDNVQAKEPDEEGAEASPKAILWLSGGISIGQGGLYRLVAAIWRGRRMREPSEADAALAVALERLLGAQDDPAVWASFMTLDLRNIRFCSPDLVVTFIDTLFERVPSLAGSEAMVRLLAYAWSVVPFETFLRWVSIIRATHWPKAGQAFGELVALRHLVRPTEAEPRQALEALLAEQEPAGSRGAAFSAAHLWGNILRRDSATELLVRVAATGDAGVDAALIDAFRVATPVPNDSATRRVLRAMVDGGVLDRSGVQHHLLQALVDLVAKQPAEVADAADAIIRHAGRDLGNIRTRWAGDVHELIQVAVGLQALGGPWRIRGLDLFEALLKVEAYEVENVLTELDGPRRRRGSAPRSRLRRRRRTAT